MNAVEFDADLIRRYDRPGPRYTSYPTAPQFTTRFDAAAAGAALAAGDASAPPLSFYVHVPFCQAACFYCGCNRMITRDRARGDAYVARLEREIALVAAQVDRRREIVQLHFGGGTPNFLDGAQLGRIVHALATRFPFARDDVRDASIELDPRFIDADGVAALADIGFNRVSLGVQDIDPDVQRAINRVQPLARTRAVVDACRANGITSINLDLVYGLPRQTVARFDRSLDAVAAIRPDRIALYGYAHLPHVFPAQRAIDATTLPDAATRLALLQHAIGRLTDAGYDYIGMDHFALPGDPLAVARARGGLRRNFMGYTTHAATDLVGIGASAISRVGRAFWQHARELPAWEAAIDAGRLPVARGLVLDDDDLLREDAIQQLMCHGIVDFAALRERHGDAVDGVVASARTRLQPLLRDGLATLDDARLVATPRGRLLLRSLAMCFDAYLADAATPRHASAI